MKLKDIILALALGGASVIAGSCIHNRTNNLQTTALEKIIIESPMHLESEFSNKEESCISDMSELIKTKYDFNFDTIFLRFSIDDNNSKVAARTFAQLGAKETDNKDFIELFGQKYYDKFKGKEVIMTREFGFYESLVGITDLWSSLYMPDPDAETLYKRALLHEIGHILFHKIKTDKLIEEFINIDIESNAAEKGSAVCHAAHPSFYTFFLCGFSDMKNHNGLMETSANEQFADIFALYMLGYISNDIKDKELIKKLMLTKEVLRVYEKNK